MATLIPVIRAPYKILMAMINSASYTMAANRRIRLGVGYSTVSRVFMERYSHFKVQRPGRGGGRGLAKANKALALQW